MCHCCPVQAPIRNNSFARAAVYSALVSETVVVTVKPNSRKGPLVEVGDEAQQNRRVRNERIQELQERSVQGRGRLGVVCNTRLSPRHDAREIHTVRDHP